jgi:hypothetical protein
MSERCEIEVGGLPVLSGCPDDAELFFISNANGGVGEFGYGQRTWASILSCIPLPPTDQYIPKFHQEKTEGDELSKTITPTAGYRVVDDSVNVSLDGTELVRLDAETALDERIMYTVAYNPDGTALITFYNAGFPLPAGQVIIIKYGLLKLI